MKQTRKRELPGITSRAPEKRAVAIFKVILVILIGSITTMAAEQNVIVRSLDTDGIMLFPYGSPEYSAAAEASLAKVGDDFLSYSVLLKNATGHGIIAYSIRWTPSDPNPVVRGLILTPRNFKTFRGGAGIAAGASRVVSFDGGPTALLGAQAVSASRTTQVAELYRAQRSIEVSLELAILDDGTAIGPDRDRKIVPLKAWLDAERDFTKRALDVKDPEELSSMARNIRDQAYESMASQNQKTRAGLFAAVEYSKEYRHCYRFAFAFFAAEVAEWVEQTDPTSAQQTLRQIKGAKQFPTIHRKEKGDQ